MIHQNYAGHNFDESMGGLGVHVTPNLDAYFLVDDETYYGAIRSQADISKN